MHANECDGQRPGTTLILHRRPSRWTVLSDYSIIDMMHSRTLTIVDGSRASSVFAAMTSKGRMC